ncbi:hypothetical protein [Neorhizobium sp. NCHU2750]|uniref:hypothetical protein n=1 Tax=Neorhizobium sp. NCHU2750 TaxID=1825976 RepID=UPI000E74238F|nr:hypothetical protein NCHU2750_15740 [Neorhizobium sp. NCHU2750]
MTSITYLDRYAGRSVAPAKPAAFGWISSAMERTAAAWNRRKTERMLEGLPQEIRKDIGWPTTEGK